MRVCAQVLLIGLLTAVELPTTHSPAPSVLSGAAPIATASSGFTSRRGS